LKKTLSMLLFSQPSGAYFGRVRVNGKLIRRSCREDFKGEQKRTDFK
jgi:hypothetical protein